MSGRHRIDAPRALRSTLRARYGEVVHRRQVRRRERTQDRALIQDMVHARRVHGLSRRAVGERMGISRWWVWRLESRWGEPYMSTLRRYALAIEVVIEHLVMAPVGKGADRLSMAVLMAQVAHAGQQDKAGKPYIEHPLRVAAQMTTEDEQVVAVLHDVVEDSKVDLALVEATFGPVVAEAVDAITHREYEPHPDYYARVRANPIALVVKRVDVADNSDPERLARLGDVTRDKLIRKYERARAALWPEEAPS